jgi:predicted metalloprotease with PDZ domain
MRARIVIGITLTMIVAVPAAFSQAAAESILLNQSSAAATVKAGTSLGNALNKAGSQLGRQIQNIPQSRVVTAPHLGAQTSQRAAQTRHVAQVKPPAPAGKSGASGGSMILSVQGGHVTHASAVPATAPQK